MSISVYVAAPSADKHHVLDIHRELLARGMHPTSSWAALPTVEESFSDDEHDKGWRAARQNDRDLTRADAVLVIARPGVGGEMFAEARFALSLGLPVVWVGRRILSAFRPGVFRAADLDEAFDVLAQIGGGT